MRKVLALILLPLMALSVSLAAKAMATADTDAGLAAFKGERGFTVLKSFETPEAGLTGYVVRTAGGKTGILYDVEDYVLSGSLLDAQGNDLARQDVATELELNFASVAGALSQAHYLVSEGAGDAPVTYFFPIPTAVSATSFGSRPVTGLETLAEKTGIAE